MRIAQLEPSSPDFSSALEEALGIGSIETVQCVRDDAFNSEVHFLTVNYGSRINAPKKLILKRNKEHDGALEYQFYSFRKEVPSLLEMVPTCYYADYDKETGISSLLLQDVSDTHRKAAERSLNIGGKAHIEVAAWESILKALAEFHAYWWESPMIGATYSMFPMRHWYCDEPSYGRHLERRRNEYSIFRIQVGDSCSDAEIGILEETLNLLPSLWRHYMAERISDRQNITLSQGDCYIGQFLVPKDPDHVLAKIVDFQEVSANLPAFDLGYLLSFFPPENHADAIDSLKRYHAVLKSSGIDTYSFNDLVDDYRLMLCFLIYVPVWDQSYGASESYWRPKFRNVMRDFKSFECMDFLKSIGGAENA